MGLRYITFESNTTGTTTNKPQASIVVFSDSIEHAQMFKALGLEMPQIIGAGLIRLDSLECFGESYSIDACATPRCTQIFRSNKETCRSVKAR